MRFDYFCFLVRKSFFAFLLPKLYKNKHLISMLLRTPEHSNSICNGLNFEDKESYYDNTGNMEEKNTDEEKHDTTAEAV